VEPVDDLFLSRLIEVDEHFCRRLRRSLLRVFVHQVMVIETTIF
jgi:hypothetical protein